MLSANAPGSTCQTVRVEIRRVEMMRQRHVERHGIWIGRHLVGRTGCAACPRGEPAAWGPGSSPRRSAGTAGSRRYRGRRNGHADSFAAPRWQTYECPARSARHRSRMAPAERRDHNPDGLFVSSIPDVGAALLCEWAGFITPDADSATPSEAPPSNERRVTVAIISLFLPGEAHRLVELFVRYRA